MNTTGASVENGWVRLYHLTFIIGVAISFVVFWACSHFFAPDGLGQETPFLGDAFHGEAADISAAQDESSENEGDGKKFAKEHVSA